MLTLPDALSAFAPYRQFMLWRHAIDDKGEPTKLPCNKNGQVCNAHDPLYWLGSDEAIAYAAALELGVAFVFTDNDPFFFFDIDDCLINGEYSELSKEVCALFPGAAMEVSTSGQGLHVFGVGKPPFGHSNKTVTERGKLELYYSKRFVALTGDRAMGDAGTQHSAGLAHLCQHYMTRSEADQRPEFEWTNAPCAEWSGHTDDGELLAHAMSNTNFFDTGGFTELFNGDRDALLMRFPDGPGQYDESRADMTLACKLAYWTGRDCDRIERLMLLSGLARNKWFKRQNNYLRATIRKACAKTDNVHQLRQHQVESASLAPAPITNDVLISEGTQFLPASNQIEYFDGCIYVQSSHSVFIPTGELLKREQFDVRYGGKIFFIDSTNDKSTKSAFEAFTQSQYCRYPMAHDTCFRPDLPTGEIVVRGKGRYVNTYVEIPVRRVKGDPSLFLNHLGKLLPDERDRDILLAYMAACVQFKGDKFKYAPLIQGVPGNGKTIITKVVEYAIGEDYCSVPQASELGSKFNEPWLLNMILVGVNDVYMSKNSDEDIIEALKPLITDERAGTQKKGVDSKTSHLTANFILNCNRKDGIKKVRGDRRFAPFFTAQQNEDDLTRDGLDADYFVTLHQWLNGDGYAIMADYLMTYDIPAELSPALSNGGRMNRAPITSSTEDALRSGISHAEQWVQEAVDEGQVGFCGGWISTHHLRTLMEYRRLRMSPLQMTDLLTNMGYVHHHALPNGRSVTRLPCDDNTKSVLYIAPNAWHLHAINDAKAACANYVDAQTKKIAATFAMTGNVV